MTTTATKPLRPFQIALAEAKALAMATGKVHTVTADKVGRAIAAPAAKVKMAREQRELEGNTADDRAENNWTENDSVGLSYQVEGDLDAQLDRDAKAFAGWYVEQHTARFASLGSAKRFARSVTRDESPARIQRKRVDYTVGFAPCATWSQGRSWRLHRYEFVVTYTTRVCYAAEGDYDFVPEERVVEYDCSGPAYVEAPHWDVDFSSYPEWEPIAHAPADWSASYLAAGRAHVKCAAQHTTGACTVCGR
jgi:hypothetical protein